MNKLPSLFGDIKDFDKVFVGFSDTYNRFAKIHDDLTKSIPNYPPYNIEKVADNKYVIEMAVAGFSKSEIEIEVENDKLIVRGNVKEDDPSNYLFKGIAARNFTRTFALDDQIEVKGAGMFNGMLQIALERIVPEHKKAKKIDISDEAPTMSAYAQYNTKQLLTEDDL